MGLAAARTLVQTDPAEAAGRIDQVRAALNETIRDVRNFITGLEPEALQSRTFSAAVKSLFEFFQTAGPAVGDIDIDESVADRLHLAARTTALQVIRECASNAIRHGNDVWFYNSKDNTAAHAQLPANDAGDTGRHSAGSDVTATPDQLAAMLLAKIEPGTDVAVGADVQVAGRPAYNLVLTPKSDATLVGSIAVAVDGQTGLPLGVEIKARGQSDPAFRVAYTSLTLGAPDASVFTFTPPPGATVEEIPVKEHKHGNDAGNATAPAAKDRAGKPAVTGSGWDSVVEFPAGTAGPLPTMNVAPCNGISRCSASCGDSSCMSPTFCTRTLTCPSANGMICSTVNDPPERGSE